MSTNLFVDTSGLFAFLNKSDVNHAEAKKQLSRPTVRITSNYVFDELMALMTARGQKDASIQFGEQLRTEAFAKYHFLTPSEEEKAWKVYQKYRDHPLSFTDCTTLAWLNEHRPANLLSFDETLLKLSKQFQF